MVVLAIGAAFIVLLLAAQYADLPWYRPAAVTAFLGHVFVTLVVLPHLPYQWDIGQFHRIATEIAAGTFTSGSSTIASFGGFQALTYTIFSPQPETVAIFNSLFAVLVVIPISALARQLYSSRTRSHLGLTLIVLFAPLQFLFLSLPMRDTLTILLFFSLLSLCLSILQSHHPTYVFAAAPLWGMLYLLRPELALIVVLGTIAGIVFDGAQAVAGSVSLKSLTAVTGVIGVIGFGLFAEILYSLESANSQLTYRASGGAAYLEGMEYTSWFDFLLAAPGRAVYFQFAPFPLHIESIFHFLAFTVSVAVIILFVAAIRSLYNCKPNEIAAVFLLVIYLSGIVGYGTINSNFGTNVRHRIAFDFLLVVFALPVIQRWESLIREWLSVVPRQCDERNKKQREAQELDRSLHTRTQNSDDTHQ